VIPGQIRCGCGQRQWLTLGAFAAVAPLVDAMAEALFVLPRDVLAADPVDAGAAFVVGLTQARFLVGDVDADAVALGSLHDLLRRSCGDPVEGLNRHLQAIEPMICIRAIWMPHASSSEGRQKAPLPSRRPSRV
jgi:hypothetical protein